MGITFHLCPHAFNPHTTGHRNSSIHSALTTITRLLQKFHRAWMATTTCPIKRPLEFGIPQESNTQQSPSPQSSQSSERSNSGGSSQQFSTRTSIEPDPLPPHSNPQALTQSQSEAFTSSQPIPAVRLGKDEVWDSVTGIADFRISREVARMPSFISSNRC